MTQMKRNNPADFGDILAALDQKPSQAASGAPSERAKRDDDQISAEDAPRPPPRLRSILGHISWPWRIGSGALRFAPAASYAEEDAELAEPVATGPGAKPAQPQPSPPQTEDEAIAEELGLHADLATAELQRIRRNFAKKNHPDRFAPAQRIGAARRMSIANMLIDAHLKQKPSGQ